MIPQRFKGTARFETRRQLGSGTAGVVYEAWDRERGCPVALKLLHQTDPASLYRFKQEFRALAHLSHPNLIQLYELQNEGEHWFVTMELIEGSDFIAYVRRPEVLEQGIAALEQRLYPVARQLARGLRALHASGRLHRDIKPSNVLVNDEGKVIVLDFGLVTKSTQQQTFQTFTDDILGTPVYMAPEQGTNQDLTEATDWYGVGTLLYEALTGEPPFSGQFVTVMLAKQQADAPPPREKVPEISAELDALCQGLLRREAAERTSGAQVMERLGSPEEMERATHAQGQAPLVGRDHELAELRRAFARVAAGATVTIYVHGTAGLGKSALVHQFLRELRQEDEDVVTLSGHCYQHETVPFKAFDSMVDMLTRFLRSLPYQETATLLPRDAIVLARLFPVLRRVPAVADSERQVLEIPDSHERRRRAFVALRELLMRLAEDRPLVLFIDDLQWGDFDSATLLSELMRPPDPPPLLLIGAYRDEDAATSPLIRALRPADVSSPTRVAGEDLVVSELMVPAAEELAKNLLASAASPRSQRQAMAREIAREAGGNPLFIDELARHTLAHGEVAQGGLEAVLRVRITELEGDARALLEVLAISGRPLELDVARRAAELEANEMAALTVLRAGHLARSTGGRGGDRAEIYHDRIAKAVLAELDATRLMVLHLRLARVLESSGRGDPETLAVHFAEAGERARALEYATEAIQKSVRALAFNRAAELCRQALELGPPNEEVERSLRLQLADMLGNAGRGAEAAAVYHGLSEGASAAESLEMRRRAAEWWLVSGHIDQGLEALAAVLEEVGWTLPSTPRRALPGLVLRRLRLRLRGYGFREKDATQIAPEVLRRIDLCWSAVIGLGTVDTLRGAYFQARHLQLALAAGEPFRVARALAVEVVLTSTRGGPAVARTRELIGTTAELVRRVADPEAFGFATFTIGVAAYMRGDWTEALGELEEAEVILRDRCTGMTWQLNNAQFFILVTLWRLGRVRELRRRLAMHLQEARERGDLYAEINLRTRVHWLADLAEDRPAEAAAELEKAIRRWSQDSFHLQHLWAEWGQVETCLYRGDAVAARERVAGLWKKVEDSGTLRIQVIGVDCREMRARAAVAAALAEPSRAAALTAEAERDSRTIARQKMPWSAPIARLLEASVMTLRGESDRARDLLRTAEKEFDAAHMALHATVARRCRGELLGGDEGRELREAADHWLREQSIQNPERLAAQLAPGRWQIS